MATPSNSQQSKPLSVEDRQALRDLSNHWGYRLVLLALEEQMAAQLRSLAESDNAVELYRAQGAYKALKQAVSLPARLLETQSPLPVRSR